MAGAEGRDRFAERRAVDVRDHRDVIAAVVPSERIDEQVGAKRGTADADVEQMTNLAERPRLDRIDQHPHPLVQPLRAVDRLRSEEHTSELQSLMRISYAVFCLKKKTQAT